MKEEEPFEETVGKNIATLKLFTHWLHIKQNQTKCFLTYPVTKAVSHQIHQICSVHISVTELHISFHHLQDCIITGI